MIETVPNPGSGPSGLVALAGRSWACSVIAANNVATRMRVMAGSVRQPAQGSGPPAASVSVRHAFLVALAAALGLVAAVAAVWPAAWWSLLVVVPLVARGVADMVQTRQAIRRNFPLIGHGRYLLEMLRPEINQYFVESNNDGLSFVHNALVGAGVRQHIRVIASGKVNTGFQIATKLALGASRSGWRVTTRKR